MTKFRRDCNVYIERPGYLEKLKRRMGNGQIKVITGMRRCGKSFLLFRIFCDFLREQGVDDAHLVSVALDDVRNAPLRDPEALYDYVTSRIADDGLTTYVLLDEIQYAISREEIRDRQRDVRLYGVLNGLMHMRNVDVYVTGSNSKLLSKDVMTEFRGRGDVVEVRPLSFREYYGYVGGDRTQAYEDYALWGGLPLVLDKQEEEEKLSYLSSLFDEVYFRDVVERYGIERPDVLGEIVDSLCSSVGSLTNANKITKTLNSVRGVKASCETVGAYLEFLTESFLFEQAKRYDVKGKRYFEYPSKYYCADIGLRNVRLGLRQQEETHIMENVIYNDLVARGLSVDVGVIELSEKDDDGARRQKSCEIDFVVNRGSARYYIQSALSMVDERKVQQELRPLLSVDDSFRKIVVSKTSARPWNDEKGVLHLGLYDFLLDENSLGA